MKPPETELRRDELALIRDMGRCPECGHLNVFHQYGFGDIMIDCYGGGTGASCGCGNPSGPAAA